MTGAERLEVNGREVETRWIGPGPAEAASIVMLRDDPVDGAPWGGFAGRLATATGCGVLVYARAERRAAAGRDSAHQEALTELTAVLDATGFQRGVLLGHRTGATVATLYTGGVADHRVRGLVLLGPRFFDDTGRGEPAWDIRESIGYIRVPILIVRGDGPGAIGPAHVEAAEEEAYCPVEVATIVGAGAAPHTERPEPTLAAVTAFVETLFVAAEEGVGFPREKGSHGR